MQRKIIGRAYAMNRAVGRNKDFYKKIAHYYNISETTQFLLYLIYTEEKSYTQLELSHRARLPVQTVNSAISKLEKKGIITLEKVSGQGRSKLVKLTSDGEIFVQEKVMPLLNSEIRDIERLSEKEYEQLIYLLNKYITYLFEEFENIVKQESEMETEK